MYKFVGVPKAFDTKQQALAFLRNSPGYVQRRSTYLQTYWPGLWAELHADKSPFAKTPKTSPFVKPPKTSPYTPKRRKPVSVFDPTPEEAAASSRSAPVGPRQRAETVAEAKRNLKKQYWDDVKKPADSGDWDILVQRYGFLKANQIQARREKAETYRRNVRKGLAEQGITGQEAVVKLRQAGILPGGVDSTYNIGKTWFGKHVSPFLAEGLYTAMMAAPSAVKLGVDVGKDVRDAATGDFDFERSRKNAGNIVHATLNPETPFQWAMTGLTVAGLGSTAALRTAAVAKALPRGTVAATKALVKSPLPEEILAARPHGGTYSRSPLMGVAQKTLDSTLYRSEIALNRRKGIEMQIENRMRSDLGQAPATAAVKAARPGRGRGIFGLREGEQAAVRIVLERGDPDARIRLVSQFLGKGNLSKSQIAVARRELKVLRDAKQHLVRGEDGSYVIAPSAKHGEYMRRLVDIGQEISDDGDAVLRGLGVMDEQELTMRRVLPQLVERGYTFKDKSWFDPDGNPVDWKNLPDDVRTDAAFVTMKTPRAGDNALVGKAAGYMRTVPVLNKSRFIPGFSQRFKGEAMRSGRYDHRTSRVLARQQLERARLKEAQRIHSDLVRRGLLVKPEGVENYVPVYTRRLTQNETAKVQRVVNEIGDLEQFGFDSATLTFGARNMDEFRELQQLMKEPPGTEIDGVVWVPNAYVKRLGLNPGSGGLHGGLGKAYRELTAAFRLSILYSGLGGYVFPNMVDNLVKNVLQGKPGLTLSRTLAWRMKHQAEIRSLGLNQKVDAIMGEGVSVASLGERFPRTPVAATTNAVASALGRVSDIPYRRNSFYAEARLKGYNTPQKIDRLLSDPDNRDLRIIRDRASDASLDFGRLRPFERDVLNKVLFIYAFTKAASRYGVRFAGEHPYVTNIVGQNVPATEEWIRSELGERPSYAKQVIPTGQTQTVNGEEMPIVVNTASINQVGPWQDLTQTVLSELGLLPDSGDSYQLTDYIAPAQRIWNMIVSGYDPFRERQIEGGVLDRARYAAEQQMPIIQDIRSARGEGKENADRRVYPEFGAQRLSRYVLGSMRPRPYNPKAGEAQAVEERTAEATISQRAYREVFKERKNTLDAVRRLAPEALENGRLPKWLRDAFNKKAAVEAARARAAKGNKGGDEYLKAVIPAELSLLADWGVISREQQKEYTNRALAGTEKFREDARNWIKRQFDKQYLDVLSKARSWLNEHGADL